MPKNRLSPRERRFVEELAKGKNQTQAIKATGFQGRRPDIAGAKLAAKPRVQEALTAILATIAERNQVTQDDWFREVWSIASAKIAKKAISASDKNKALELAGRALGSFKDTAGEREVVGPGLTIIIQQGQQTSHGHAPAPQALQVNVGLPGPER
jgi:phage terminase small subunit